jgi:putative ABC transport system permease protein
MGIFLTLARLLRIVGARIEEATMDMLLQDLRHALRSLLARPATSAVIVATLGLGIGVTTAVFSLIDAVLLRPLPVREADRVVRVRESLSAPDAEPQLMSLSPATYRLWREKADVFEGLAAATGTELVLTGADRPERFSGASVTWDFFHVLGIEPVLGRTFRPEEDRPGGDRVVLLGHALWQRRFGADPHILGKTLLLNGAPHTVLGVLPPALSHPYRAEMWVPLALGEATPMEHSYYLYAPARLRPGIGLEQAERELADLAGRLTDRYPPNAAPRQAHLTPLREELSGRVRPLLAALLVAAGLVLLISGANVSSLLLARLLEQGREMAIRTALGASTGRLVRLFLCQSLLLAGLGCGAGLILALWSVGPIAAASPLYTEAIQEFDASIRLDAATFGFSVFCALAAGVFFGLLPALKAARFDPQSVLQREGRSSTLGRGGRRALAAVVASELAVAAVLLVGSGLLLQSFGRLLHTERGFDVERVLTLEVAFPHDRYPELRQRAAFLRAALEGIRALPGVAAAGFTSVQPLFPGTWTAPFNVEGQTAPEPPGYRLVHHRSVSPGYFSSMQIPLLAGRDFTAQDDGSAPPVVVVSESLAQRYWPGQDPIGRRLRIGGPTSQRPWMSVVGVVGTLRETQDENLTWPDAWYLPYAQGPGGGYDTMTFVVKARLEPHALTPAVCGVLWSVDRDMAVYNVATLEELLGASLRQERFAALLVGLFGALGLALAAVGIYGVMSAAVARRTGEIGIRMALGARPRDIYRTVLGRGLLLAGAGGAAGLLAALALGRLMQSLLFEVSSADPLSFAASALVLGAVAFAACAMPARRATRVDPIAALHQD